ncbi:MAG: YebC/PmpR family DNA-binding transcriptional regulator [Enhygromyxa sp.]
MSGHSKWSTIKRKKGATDAARGKVFTKVAREIMVAAKLGGGDPDGNPRLRAALLAARAANMPKENQERAIKKGLGELEGVEYEELLYEGRGPAGSAFVLEVLTDNRNRTVPELRHILGKAGGEMGASGSATWMFDHKGVLMFGKSHGPEGAARDPLDETTLMERALEAGADDVQDEGDYWVVTCDPTSFSAVEDALADLEPESAQIQWVVKPENALPLTGEAAIDVAKLWARLDENDDIQKVYCNADLPDDIMEEHGP